MNAVFWLVSGEFVDPPGFQQPAWNRRSSFRQISLPTFAYHAKQAGSARRRLMFQFVRCGERPLQGLLTSTDQISTQDSCYRSNLNEKIFRSGGGVDGLPGGVGLCN